MAFAVVCCGLGALAHLLGGGIVTAPLAVTALAVSFAAAVPATGRERGTEAIFSLLVGVQVVLHLLFYAAPSLLAPMAVPFGHSHSGLVPSAGMLVAHGLATVMTALWLSRGEAALWALLRRLGVRLCLWTRIPHRTVYGPVTVYAFEPAPLHSALLEHSSSGRAPPRSPAT
ncbi:MFS transporter [Nonomuraea sp. SYSU D8015]|uniref:MFS transporter n=1 Tax=Nonomuraea sp. SYSU D8015 TaxID=2593644 RepID=UPI001CB6C3F1|nr:MFS transporter [Nonomuraea sp. SYSU D8015]